MPVRSVYLSDLFEIKCKRCNSTDVYITVDVCHECGNSINCECNRCGLRFDSYDFITTEVRYDSNGKEMDNDLDLNTL